MKGHPAEQAIRAAWTARGSSTTAGLSARAGAGYRALIDVVVTSLVEAGIDSSSIIVGQSLNLPGSYGVDRPWDIIVALDGIPAAAIEVHTAVGSFGNNFSNRTSEMISMAADVERQYNTNELRAYKPCVGALFVLEENAESTRPIRRRRGVMSTEESVGTEASYKERYGAFFQKLMSDRLYDAVCYLTATPLPDVQISEPSTELGFDPFIAKVARRISDLNDLKSGKGFDSVEFGRLLALRNDLGDVMSGLASTSAGLSAAELAVVERRRQIVNELIFLSLHEEANETKIHKAIGNRYWIFGGQYVGVAPRRDLMPLDEHDIPLVCADGSLEIVELKGPESKIVKKYRNHLIVSNEVHEAVSQCMGYLRTIDELGSALRTSYRNELGLDYDYRRARGVVVIGHPGRVKIDNVTREQIDQAVRSYNAHLSRVRVVTYADLLESAERMLRFESEVRQEDQVGESL